MSDQSSTCYGDPALTLTSSTDSTVVAKVCSALPNIFPIPIHHRHLFCFPQAPLLIALCMFLAFVGLKADDISKFPGTDAAAFAFVSELQDVAPSAQPDVVI